MLNGIGEGFGFVQFEQNVHVIGDGVNGDYVASFVGQDARCVGVQARFGVFAKDWATFFGGENQVNDIAGERLGHDLEIR